MNDLNKTLLVGVCVLAFTTALFFFKYTAQKARNDDLLTQKESAYLDAKKSLRQAESQNEKVSEIKDSAELAQNQSDEYFELAASARAELERLKAASEIERKELEAYYNSKIEREVASKQKIERELEKLATQKDTIEVQLLDLAGEFEIYKSNSAQNLSLIEENAKKAREALEGRIKALEAENARLSELAKALNEAKVRAEASEKRLEQTLNGLLKNAPSPAE